MKMIFVVYSHAADELVVNTIKQAGVKGYTKLEKACGEGTETEPKLHTHTWPGENCVLFLAVDNHEIEQIAAVIRQLKHDHPRSGVRGFVMPMEELI